MAGKWLSVARGEGSKFLHCVSYWYIYRDGMQDTISKTPHIHTTLLDMPIKPINHYINCHLESDLILRISRHTAGRLMGELYVSQQE